MSNKIDTKTIRSIIATIYYGVPRANFKDLGQNLPKTKAQEIEARGTAKDEKAVAGLTVDVELLKRGLKPVEPDDGQ